MRFIGPSLLGLVLLASACGGDDDNSNTNYDSSGGSGTTGGNSNVGGNSATGGSRSTSAGSTAVGGDSLVGGGSNVGGSGTLAGTTSTGGSSNIGGSTPLGGTTNNSVAVGGATSGGGSGTGGTPGGGASNTGGTSAKGGSLSGGSAATGGSKPTGGSASNGGVTSTGGKSNTGGIAASGGSGPTGGATTAGGTTSSAGGTTPVGGSNSTGGESYTGGTLSTGGLTATGGTSMATGGTSTSGGTTVAGGSSGTGGGGGTGAVTGWTCPAAAYSNGQCDCGCGVHDPECDNVTSAACTTALSAGCCQSYLLQGSCVWNTGTALPYSAIDPLDSAKCITTVPQTWTCDLSLYGDKYHFCDCGCGAPDSDCDGVETSDYCDQTQAIGACSFLDGASVIDPNQNWLCSPPAPGWSCSPTHYGTHDGCDCGCGIHDPDCGSAHTSSACQGTCNSIGSCAQNGDCSWITSTENATCLPKGWTCPIDNQHDGKCDCGCGILDNDCLTSARASCETCDLPGSCAKNCGNITENSNYACTN